MAIDSDRFRIPRTIHINFLEEQIEKWLFLPTSRKLAGGEIDRRRKEMKEREMV
jgi:hypothetical protein